MDTVVSATAVDAAVAAAEAIAEQTLAAIAERGAAAIALSGGKTPEHMVKHLATLALPWELIHLFQVDERSVQSGDSARNWSHLQGLAERLPSRNRHPMPVEVSDADSSYASELRAIAGRPAVLDVVHLGIGDDGHTASLAPDDAVLDVTDRDVAWVDAYRGYRRLTLTLPVLAAARSQVWLVAGADKAEAVRDLLSGTSNSPAARAATAVATLEVDVAAASLMSSR